MKIVLKLKKQYTEDTGPQIVFSTNYLKFYKIHPVKKEEKWRRSFKKLVYKITQKSQGEKWWKLF